MVPQCTLRRRVITGRTRDKNSSAFGDDLKTRCGWSARELGSGPWRACNAAPVVLVGGADQWLDGCCSCCCPLCL